MTSMQVRRAPAEGGVRHCKGRKPEGAFHMPNTTINITDEAIDITEQADIEFAIGAARYLQQAGLTNEAIAISLVDELGIDLTAARHITLSL